MADRPNKTLADLRAFYTNEYRPLYDRFMVVGAAAQELHTEVACAADHLFFLSQPDGEISPEDIERAMAHLKRATFDAFKLVFESEIRGQYNELMNRKYLDVHDGKFRSEITSLWIDAKETAIIARLYETKSRRTDEERWGSAFEEWKRILPLADKFTSLKASPEVVSSVKEPRSWRIRASVLWVLSALLSALFGVILGKLVK